MLLLKELNNSLSSVAPHKTYGKVVAVRGPCITASLPLAAIGDICRIPVKNGSDLFAQIISFQNDLFTLAPFADVAGVAPHTRVENLSKPPSIKFNSAQLGSVLDSAGNHISNEYIHTELNQNTVELPLFQKAPNPLTRKPINQVLKTGIKAIDCLTTLGYGQRIGLFAGAGIGKSTLLGMIARNAEVDINVIALVGERGREVNEFIEQALGQEVLKKSILVVATSDQSALQRSLAAQTATAIAEYYRNQGKRVLLLVDSLTRTARAIRDVSLAAGEVPVRQGLTASVYSELPKLIERAGNNQLGSITAIYTMLDTVEYELDALAEEVKSLLDGHLILESNIALLGIRPAIDFTKSISRVMNNIVNEEHLRDAGCLRKIITRLRKDKEIIALGGVADAELSTCLALEPQLLKFLSQKPNENHEFNSTINDARQIAKNFYKENRLE